MSSNTTDINNTSNKSEFQDVKKRSKYQKRNEDNNTSNKPRLTFKQLLFELNNLKKYQHSPKVDLHERNNSYVIRMELPGLSKEDISIQLRDNQFLLISGNKVDLTSQQDDNTIYKECHFGNFMRRVKVPTHVYKNSIKTTMSNGVLVVTVDKLPHVEEKIDARLDESFSSTPSAELPTIPEGKVIDFSSLGDFTGKSWADEE